MPIDWAYDADRGNPGTVNFANDCPWQDMASSDTLRIDRMEVIG